MSLLVPAASWSKRVAVQTDGWFIFRSGIPFLRWGGQARLTEASEPALEGGLVEAFRVVWGFSLVSCVAVPVEPAAACSPDPAENPHWVVAGEEEKQCWVVAGEEEKQCSLDTGSAAAAG